MGVMPAVVIELKAKADEFKTTMGEARSEVEKLSNNGADNFQKLQAVGQGVFLGLAGAATGFAAMSVAAAVSQEAANARLTTALHDVGSAMTATSKPVDELDAHMRSLGFTNADTTDGLAKLTTATKNPTEAMKDMSLAADIARGRNIDLSSATDILVKVETGHVAMLGRLGINTKDATGATISQQEAIQRLTDLYGGQAGAYADTFQGKMAVLKSQIENVQEQVGMFLIPKIEDLVSIGAGAIKWAEDHKTASETFAAVIGGPLVIALGVYIAEQTKSLALTVATMAMKLPQFFLDVGAAIAGTTAEEVVLNGTLATTISTTLAGAGAIGLLAARMYDLKVVNDEAKGSAEKWAAEQVQDIPTVQGKIDETNKLLQEQQDKTGGVHSSWLGLDSFWRQSTGANTAKDNVAALKQQLQDLQKEQSGASGTSGDLSAKIKDLTGQIDQQTTTAAKAPKSIKDFSDAVAVLRDNTADATEKVKAFKMAVDTLVGNAGPEQSQIKFLDSAQALGDALAKNGSNFNLTSGAGRLNRTALESAVGAARDQLTAMQSSGASNTDLQNAFNSQRASLLNTIQYYGFTSQDANNILAQEGFAPSNFAALMNASAPGFTGGQAGNAAISALSRSGYNALAGAAAGAPGSATQDLVFNIDGQTFGRIAAPLVQTQILQNLRSAVAAGLS